MSDDDPKTTDNAEFDAVQAAAELAAALGDAPASGEAGTGVNPTNYIAILEDEVEALGRVIAEKDQALALAQERADAARAEVSRARARLERDAAVVLERKRRDIIVSFLDVADDLDRAAAELSAGDIHPPLVQGVLMVSSKLQTVLIQHGAKLRSSLGLTFDPAHHEAVGTVPATDETPAGTIAAVLREGYDVGDQTLRPARVVVAKD